MCGRFSLATPFEVLAKRCKSKLPRNYNPNYNIALGGDVLAIAIDEPDEMNYLKWGLVPFWANEKKKNIIFLKPFPEEKLRLFTKKNG